MSAVWVIIKTFWKPLSVALVLLAVAAAVGWYGHEQYKAGYAARNVLAQQQAAKLLANSRAVETKAQTQMEAVRNDANQQKQVAVAAIDNLRGESDRLRDAIADAARRAKAQASGTTARADAAATRAWNVLEACRVRYAAVVSDTDGYVEDLRIGQGWAKVIMNASGGPRTPQVQ